MPRKRINCHAAVQMAKQCGKLVPQPCEKCGSEESIHAHHEDYSKPLSVNWLCRKCHIQLHRERLPKINQTVRQIKGISDDSWSELKAYCYLNGMSVRFFMCSLVECTLAELKKADTKNKRLQ
jgi:hypothetical protein